MPSHMLGAKPLEQRVLGGYVSHIKALRPQATTPQAYRTDPLIEDVRSHRQRMGDEAFIQGLAGADYGDGPVGTEPEGDGDGWGDEFAWTPELLSTPLAAEELNGARSLSTGQPEHPGRATGESRAPRGSPASPGTPPRTSTVSARWTPGPAVITEHAKSLDCHGLILGLANHVHDQKFVSRDADKTTSFVEGAHSRRAVPIVSFIARRRDVRWWTWVGYKADTTPAATLSSVADPLRHPTDMYVRRQTAATQKASQPTLHKRT
ncbi:hypothetical protein ACIPK9_08600 [Streptomyces sp. NPDC086771]|uniref:hypothetical protein n=2 Tax=Streptomyces TaxID=1883 RepID=UPI003826BA5A